MSKLPDTQSERLKTLERVTSDALIVHNKCSKLSSELLAENEELKEVLSIVHDFCNRHTFPSEQKLEQMRIKSRYLLTKYNNQ